MFDIESFHRKYRSEHRDLIINDRNFDFLVPDNIDSYIDWENPVAGFPLWAKIWEPSLILAQYMANIPASKVNHILEIGSGIGLVGVVAASFGQDITMSEYDLNALDFITANAHINHCPDVKICRLDWHRPEIDGRFDTIIGSEVMFKEQDFRPLLNLFRKYLRPRGRIILASGVRRGTVALLHKFDPHYHARIKKYTIRSDGTSLAAILCELTPTH